MVQETALATDSLATLADEGVDFESEIKISWKAISGSGKVSKADAEHAEKVVTNNQETQETYFSGGTAFSPTAKDWYQGLMEAGCVAPISSGLHVEFIASLLTVELFPLDVHIKAKAGVLKQALDGYCEFLGPDVCTHDPIDPPPPPTPTPDPVVDTGVSYTFAGAVDGEKVMASANGKNVCFIVGGYDMNSEADWCRVVEKDDGYFYLNAKSDDATSTVRRGVRRRWGGWRGRF